MQSSVKVVVTITRPLFHWKNSWGATWIATWNGPMASGACFAVVDDFGNLVKAGEL